MLIHKERASKNGFTLIELLVVITIIGLLISILVPSLRSARDQAKDTQCLSRLRALYLSHATYLHDYNKFPPLNNEVDDGTWQYNYLIYDGTDFSNNFGPLVEDGRSIDFIEQLFCPVQQDAFHSLSTEVNPWPTIEGLKSRSGYGRRYRLSGLSLSDLKTTIAILADIFHFPEVVYSAHKDGVNAAYSDGHAQWVHDPGIFANNELTSPFEIEDNEIVEDMWDVLDEAI